MLLYDESDGTDHYQDGDVQQQLNERAACLTPVFERDRHADVGSRRDCGDRDEDADERPGAGSPSELNRAVQSPRVAPTVVIATVPAFAPGGPFCAGCDPTDSQPGFERPLADGLGDVLASRPFQSGILCYLAPGLGRP